MKAGIGGQMHVGSMSEVGSDCVRLRCKEDRLGMMNSRTEIGGQMHVGSMSEVGSDCVRLRCREDRISPGS
nr:hypothetical protein [Tanacetum cinerariifolium]